MLQRERDFPYSQKLLAEADYQLDVASALRKRFPSASIFHATMAIELADKCIRELGATFGSLVRARLIEPGDLAQFRALLDSGEFGPQERKNRHQIAALLDKEWLRGGFEREADEFLEKVRAACCGQNPYEACRYPDKWPQDSPPPHKVLQPVDAQNAIKAAGYHVAEALVRSYETLYADDALAAMRGDRTTE